MRFRELHLRPFGAFQDLRFDLDPEEDAAGAGGLHLVYGSNGAGKSTTLSAIRSALFGIPSRTGNHRFPSKELRIGAHLAHSDGRELRFTRRSSPKSPLWTEGDDEALAEEELLPFLGELSRQQFESIYGLDLATMMEGGEQLLRGEGDLGRALFGASLGGTQLATISGRLDGEIAELYGDTAIKARINAGLARWKEGLAQLKRESSSLNAHKKQQTALNRSLRRETELLAERAACRQEVREADSMLRGLVPLGRIERARDERARLGALEPLPADKVKRLRAIAAETSTLEAAIRERAEGRRERAERMAESEAVAEDRVLGQGAAIEELAGGVEAFRLAQERLPEVGERLAALRAAAGPAQGGLLPGLDVAAALAALEGHALEQRSAEQASRTAREELEEARARFARAQEAAQGADATIEESLAVELSGLAPFRGGLAELLAAAPPHAAVVQERQELESARDQRAADRERRRTAAEAAAAGARSELEQLAAEPAGAPPTPADLAAARAAREAAWDELQAALQGTAAAAPQSVTAFAQAVARADAIADRLRLESERSLRSAAAQRSLETAVLELEGLDREEQQERDRSREEDERWRAAWPFEPLGGTPMAAWMRERTAILERAEQAQAALRQAVDEQAATLDARQAKWTCAQAASDGARAAYADWAERSGLHADAGIEHARERLQAQRLAGEAAQSLSELEPEHGALQRLVQDFQKRAGELSQATGIGWDAQGSDDGERALTRAELLRAGLQRARSAQVALESERKAQAADDGKDARDSARLAELAGEREREVKAAGAADWEELFAHAERSERLLALDRELEVAAEELGGLPIPWTVEALQEALAQRPREELADAHGAAVQRLETLDEEYTALRESIGGLRQEVERDGRDEAARIESEQASLLASLEDDTRRYVQVVLAKHLLEREIEAHRTQHQGPLLSRAGELFELLTLGAYERLVPGVEGQKRVICARRPDGRDVGTMGMSTGTCDQLYLALRIASVEQMLRTAEPMPFIADDLFVNFDDERTEAALRVLFQLAAHTQVIVFSHHRSVVEIARRLGSEGVPIHLHELEPEQAREAAALAAAPESSTESTKASKSTVPTGSSTP